MGAIDLIGWVTKVTEYKSEITIKKRIRVTASTTMPQTLTSISSVVRFNFINFFLQDWCYQVFWASLGKQTSGLLALCCMKVVRVLALIAILFFAASK
jgi:hypothetical protein